MKRNAFAWMLGLLLGALTAGLAGQITIPYTFTAGTIIDPDQMNTNFTTIGTGALNRSAGTMTGTLTTQQLTPASTNLYDLGTAAALYRTAYMRTSLVLGQTTANYTLTWANPAAARAISIADPGGTDVFTFNQATQTLTNKTLTAPVLSGTVTGTYTLGGTPTFPATVVLTTAIQTLTNKTLTAPAIGSPVFSGSASGTGIDTSAVSTGNFVGQAVGGTGITSSLTSGNAVVTTISLNNTAVTPASYGTTTGASFTVDQQGRLTTAANATITSLGTVTTGVWNAGAVTSSGALVGVGSLSLTGTPDSTPGISLQALTTGRPTFDFRNATTGLLAEILATNTKGFQFWTNGASTLAMTLDSAGALSTGAVTSSGLVSANASLLVAGTPVARFQNTGGSGLGSGAGIEIYAGGIQAFNRTGGAYAPFAIDASALSIGAPTTVAGAITGTVFRATNTSPTTAGDIGYSSAYGMYTYGKTGSTDDWAVFGAAGGYVAHVPTGTVNLVLAGSLHLGSVNLTDAIAVPTIASGFGSGATIAGKAYGFNVTVGSGSNTGGTVNFNATYANVPACVAPASVNYPSSAVSATTTTVSMSYTAMSNAGTVIPFICRGF